MTQFVDGMTFATETCCKCGIAFAMTVDFQRRRRADRGTFYCPAGHGQHYTGKSEEQKLREKVEQLERDNASAFNSAARAREERDQIARAHTRMRTRVMNGVCPCCNRTFQNLLSHMRSEHQSELNVRTLREAYGMTQAAVAKEIGINGAYVSLVERGKPVPTYVKTALDNWLARQEPAGKKAPA